MRESAVAPPGITCRCRNVIPFSMEIERRDGWVYVCRHCGRTNFVSLVVVASVEIGRRVGRYGPG